MVKDSSDQVDITVSISGGSAANISGSVAVKFIGTKKALHFDIMNWNKVAKRKIRTVLE